MNQAAASRACCAGQVFHKARFARCGLRWVVALLPLCLRHHKPPHDGTELQRTESEAREPRDIACSSHEFLCCLQAFPIKKNLKTCTHGHIVLLELGENTKHTCSCSRDEHVPLWSLTQCRMCPATCSSSTGPLPSDENDSAIERWGVK